MAKQPCGSPEENGQLIYQAVLYNNNELLSELLDGNRNSLNLEFRDSSGYTAMHIAAANGSIKCLELLISAGGDVDAVCGRPYLLRSPLHLAAERGQLEAVRRLIQARAALLFEDIEQHCALELAQMANQMETACLLIDALEAERNQAKQLHEQLINGCKQGNAEAVSKVLTALYPAIGAAVLNGTKLDEQHALYIACQQGYGEIVAKLLQVTGHVLVQKQTNDTVLHAAISSQNLIIVCLILKAFSHLVRVANSDGSLPLHWACQCGSVDIVRALLDRPYPDTAMVDHEDPSGRIQYRFPFDVNALDKECHTALYLAVANGHIEVVRYLLQFEIETRSSSEAGGSGKRIRPFTVDVYCTGGRTPLMIAAANGSVPIVQLLLDNGANVNLPTALTDAEVSCLENEEIRCVGSGALNEACRTGHVQLAALLLKCNAVDHDNRALAIAAQNGHEPIVRLLLSQLVFADPEFRINKKSMEFLVGQMSLNRNLMPSTVYPTISCMLNWHGAGLAEIDLDWLVGACLQMNNRLRTSRMALAALTRIDISGNRLEQLSCVFLQLPSLRTLNAGHNRIARLETSVEGWNAPMLETINLEHNLLERLPEMIFCSLLPNLQTLDISNNKLTALPDSIWSAIKLKDLNASFNQLAVLPAMHHSTPMNLLDRPNSLQHESLLTRKSNESLNSTGAIKGGLDGNHVLDDHVQVLELCRYNLWQRNIQLAKVDDDEIEPLNGGGSSSASPFVQLNLAGNQLAFVPSCLACVAPRLVRLNLSENRLSSLGPISSFPARLRHLDLSKNRLQGPFSTPTPVELVCHSNTTPGLVGTARLGGCGEQLRSTSPTRHSRSRSKSAVRSRRSLSVASTADGKKVVQVEACAHKRHNRLEYLKTLNISGNRLNDVPLLVTIAENTTDVRSNLLFPNLTVLDLSDNRLGILPKALSEMTSLSVLNASNNQGISELPPELALLSRLWNLNLKGCRLREPLRTMIAENYKTTDLIAYLKSILEDSKPYSRMKLMVVGIQGIGKTSLLEQLRAEGTSSRRTKDDSWSKRMGHKNGGTKTAKGANMSTVGVDVGDWTFEPKKAKSSNNEQVNFGPVTFRTWDFGGQREYYATHQYFLSRRSLYLVVWKVTDGEAGISDVHQWLVNIQARAPNSPVLIIGTHYDQVMTNSDKFPHGYLDELDRLIRDRFILVGDADKKGLPRVIETMFVSCKTRHNIRNLAGLLYRTAYDQRCLGTKERLLEQKIPASYLALEKIVVNLADERRAKGVEPVMHANEFRSLVQDRMQVNYGRSFRDLVELNQACAFLHENGVMLHYDDSTLKDLYFLDPQWLCDVLAHVITIREINPFAKTGLMRLDDLNVLFKSLKLSNVGNRLKQYIVSLLHKFEVALTWDSRCLLIPSLLPDEYQLRAGYPGCEVKIGVKMNGWHLVAPPSKSRIPSLFSQKSFDGTDAMNNRRKISSSSITSKKKQIFSLDGKQDSKGLGEETKIQLNVHDIEQEMIRRLYMMAYVPSGFWSRLITRILADEHVNGCMEKLFRVESEKGNAFERLKHICNKQFKPDWLLWQTGIEVTAFGHSLFSLKQYLPLAEIRDIHYDQVEWKCKHDDSNWRTMDFGDCSILELQMPSFAITVSVDDQTIALRTERATLTRLLAIVVDIIDTLLEDWYPALGTRFVHTSEGRLLVNRLVPCPKCLLKEKQETVAKLVRNDSVKKENDGTATGKAKAHPKPCPRSKSVMEFGNKDVKRQHTFYAFSIEECILCAHDTTQPNCPTHLKSSLSDIAPDTVFLDINQDFLIGPDTVKRGKLLGRGAFGFVFRASVKMKDQPLQDAALKMLEPVDPGFGARASSVAAFKAAETKWQRDPLQNACRAYCTSRQELNVLTSLQHGHVTALIGVCPRPLALVVELAPLGALNALLSNYRRSGARLNLSVIQDTASQVAKALEYLHEHHIIYRDLKCENVLVWRYPPPFSAALTEVLVKLGDYGISRSSFPSGGAKGFGGTEGFMAPEIMRYNGEQEYTEKVDCFSFAMFLYELISLKLPFDGQEQLKEFVLDGGRPQLTPSELLYPCNLLDLMVVCWAQQSADRPTASQLVSMTTAPEFAHLLDVVSLNVPDTEVLAAVALTTDDSETANDDGIEGELWLSRADGTISVLGCNQFGWLDAKSITVSEDSVVTAMGIVDDSVWMAEMTGLVRVYCQQSYSERYNFTVAPIVKTGQLSVRISAMAVGINFVLLGAESVLILCRPGRAPAPVVASIRLDRPIHSLVVLPLNSRGLTEIWIGESEGKMDVYSITAGDDSLASQSTCSHFSERAGEEVRQLVTNRTVMMDPVGHVWTMLYPSNFVFQWSVPERKISARLDVSKILPSSESISTLDVEIQARGHVTTMCLLERCDGAQLFIGTSCGVIVVAQAQQLRPLASFRPYMAEVSSMVCCTEPSRRTTTNAARSVSSGTRGASSTSSTDGHLLDTVSWMKDRVSETVNKLRQSGSAENVNVSSSTSNACVMTVGSGYRCLIDRFMDKKQQTPQTGRRQQFYSIIWRTDEWANS